MGTGEKKGFWGNENSPAEDGLRARARDFFQAYYFNEQPEKAIYFC
jgi:hypothetical protein